ncbi:MAG: zf-HC2 domain-containing protein [Bacteroidota bacterium]
MRLQHRKHQVLISALVDGELEDDERQELEEHVSVCAECERLLSDFRLLKEVGTGAKPFPGNPFYLTRLRAALGRATAIPWGASEIEAKLFGPLFTILLLGLILLLTMTERRGAIAPEEYLFGGRRTLVEQQLLSRSGQVSKDEVLLLTVSTQRREELYGR